MVTLANFFFTPQDGDFDKTAEASDLYDAVLTGFGDQNKKVPSKVESPVSKDRAPEEKKKSLIVDPKSGEKNSKKYPVYVGNFSWVSHAHRTFSFPSHLY